jgi:hypothetical protein
MRGVLLMPYDLASAMATLKAGLRAAASSVFCALALGCALGLAACSSQPQEPPARATPPVASQPAPSPADDATQPATGASQPREESPAADRWNVDLRRDEQRGGHALARHVGRTDAQLQARLRRESISAASTYPDLETAERTVIRALDADATRVRVWIDRRAPKPNLAIRYRAPRDGIPIGRVLDRGDTASHDARGAVVVLRWRDNEWHVLTTYPEDVR